MINFLNNHYFTPQCYFLIAMHQEGFSNRSVVTHEWFECSPNSNWSKWPWLNCGFIASLFLPPIGSPKSLIKALLGSNCQYFWWTSEFGVKWGLYFYFIVMWWCVMLRCDIVCFPKPFRSLYLWTILPKLTFLSLSMDSSSLFYTMHLLS